MVPDNNEINLGIITQRQQENTQTFGIQTTYF